MYGAKEQLMNQGFTEELNHEEARKLLEIAPDERVKALKSIREQKIKELERETKIKELAIESLKIHDSGKYLIKAKKRDGSFTKSKNKKQKIKDQKKQVKQSKRKNRKRK